MARSAKKGPYVQPCLLEKIVAVRSGNKREAIKTWFEFKYSDSPKSTKSMNIALETLKLDHLYVIFPGTMSFPMTEKITACGLDALREIKL